MKSLRVYMLLPFLWLMCALSVQGQSVVEERIERYLFSSYESNKAGLKEGERVLKQLESRLDQYLVSLDKTAGSALKEKEKEFDAFLKQLSAVKDIKTIQQLVEDSRRSHKAIISSVLQQGVKSVDEVQECKKAMAFKLMEMELLQLRQDRLFNLLKDEAHRKTFIASLVAKSTLKDDTDLRKLMGIVDMSLTEKGS